MYWADQCGYEETGRTRMKTSCTPAWMIDSSTTQYPAVSSTDRQMHARHLVQDPKCPLGWLRCHHSVQRIASHACCFGFSWASALRRQIKQHSMLRFGSLMLVTFLYCGRMHEGTGQTQAASRFAGGSPMDLSQKSCTTRRPDTEKQPRSARGPGST